MSQPTAGDVLYAYREMYLGIHAWLWQERAAMAQRRRLPASPSLGILDPINLLYPETRERFSRRRRPTANRSQFPAMTSLLLGLDALSLLDVEGVQIGGPDDAPYALLAGGHKITVEKPGDHPVNIVLQLDGVGFWPSHASFAFALNWAEARRVG